MLVIFAAALFLSLPKLNRVVALTPNWSALGSLQYSTVTFRRIALAFYRKTNDHYEQ
jgi:hypothetical protein